MERGTGAKGGGRRVCVSAQLSYRSVFMSYRTDQVEIVNTFQYNDSANDYFEREPYSVLVRSKQEPGRKKENK